MRSRTVVHRAVAVRRHSEESVRLVHTMESIVGGETTESGVLVIAGECQSAG
jgi:hypothetical protein